MFEELIEKMARSLFVEAYASHQEQLAEQGEEADLAQMGQDWFEVAPDETPQIAYVLAGRILGIIETKNNTAWYTITAKAQSAYKYDDDKYIEELGHYLIMEVLGHGVAWTDNHDSLELELPYMENPVGDYIE